MSAELPAGLVCLYFGNPDECQGCGGWTGAEGGPFPGDSRYCSEDCAAEAARRSEEAAARVRCCPSCGYDNREHGPDCEIVPGGLLHDRAH